MDANRKEVNLPAVAQSPASLTEMGVTIGFMAVVAAVFFALGIFWSQRGEAAPRTTKTTTTTRTTKTTTTKTTGTTTTQKSSRIIYPKETKIDFEGVQIEGEIRNPGEFYFQHKTDEKFDSLVQRRKNFHREMLRDVVMSK